MEDSRQWKSNETMEESRRSRSNSILSTAISMVNKEPLIIARAVAIRGRRLRQILHVLPIDVMEVQILAREFFSRCDLQETYMSLDKCAETFGISRAIAQGVYAHIRSNDVLDDAPFNFARQLALLYPQSGGYMNELPRLYGQGIQQDKLHLHTPRQSMLQLPSLYLTFENFVEAAVYLSPRASIQQRFDLAFSIFDSNGDGVVDVQEIKSVMMDSLQLNLKHNSSDSKNVEDVFRKEVEELLNDLKTQYRADHDQFSKQDFFKFAHGNEFLNFFTVNKHWLRDILGDNKDNVVYNRPQDAEMKGFLEKIYEEGIDNEEIINLQETLRDHLVDTVDDLKTIKPKYYSEMKINRRISTAICKKIKEMKTEGDDEYQVIIPTKSDEGPTVIDPLVVTKYMPSMSTRMKLMFISIYIVVIAISALININKSIKGIIGSVSSSVLYFCLFMCPLSSYYPFITRCITFGVNSTTTHIVQYLTSHDSQQINAVFAACFTVIHILSYVSSVNIYGIIVAVFSVALCFMWRRRNKEEYNAFSQKNMVIWTVLRLTFIISFMSHSCLAGDDEYHLGILIALLPSLVIIIVQSVDCILSKRMDVVLARNERPNFLLLSIKNNHKFKWTCGQYVHINCPTISSWEYHPFHITSSPDSKYIQISVLSCGDWTQKLWQLYVTQNNELCDLKICGPYGIGFTANKMNYNYDYLLIVAAGDGSTEIIASLLNFVCSNFLENDKHPIKKIYFYWMVSADDGCYWFYKLLRDLRACNVDKFFPCIFVTSPNEDKSCAFGLNFFLALRKESLNTNQNLTTQQIGRLSAERITTFGAKKPVSIFQRPSRFHNQNIFDLNVNINYIDTHSKHGVEIKANAENNDDDIPMQSPDFRHELNKIREELLQQNMHTVSMPYKHKVQSNHQVKTQGSLHGIIPALVVATASGRAYQIGTFFVGTELLELRLKHLCQQFTDNQVSFDFNSIVIGEQYTNRYSN